MYSVAARRNQSPTILQLAQQSPTYLFPATTTWTKGWTLVAAKSVGSDILEPRESCHDIEVMF